MTKIVKKNSLDDLALFGGIPTFTEPLHVGRPNVGDTERFLEHARDILDRRWLTNAGQYVQEFEKRIEELVNVKHCVAVCNATIGLELAIRALELSGEVIVPSFTFVATANVLPWSGIKPVFCDVDLDSHNITAEQVERLITPRTTGILGVHLWGRPCQSDQLQELATANNVKLLFDAAHAFGTSYRGRMIGNLGDAEVFSFHATKFINTFEGGAVVTNDDELAERIRLLRNFGFTGFDHTASIGINGKMNEVCAAMGLVSLDALDTFIRANERIYNAYRKRLDTLPGMRVVFYDGQERNNFQYVVVEVDQERTGICRDLLIQLLHRENVLARRYFFPGCHRMEPYRSLFPNADQGLANTNLLAQRVLCLPTGTAVGQEQVEVICGLIRLAVERGPEISSRLGVPAGRQVVPTDH